MYVCTCICTMGTRVCQNAVFLCTCIFIINFKCKAVFSSGVGGISSVWFRLALQIEQGMVELSKKLFVLCIRQT